MHIVPIGMSKDIVIIDIVNILKYHLMKIYYLSGTLS